MSDLLNRARDLFRVGDHTAALFSGVDIGISAYKQSEAIGAVGNVKLGINLFESRFFMAEERYISVMRGDYNESEPSHYDPPLSLLVSPFEINLNLTSLAEDKGEPVTFRHRVGLGVNISSCKMINILFQPNFYAFINHTPDFKKIGTAGGGIDGATGVYYGMPGFFVEGGRDFLTDSGYVMFGLRWSTVYNPISMIIRATSDN